MPELPEIEHLRRSLLPHLPGARVETVRLHRPDVLRGRKNGRGSRPGRDLLAGETIEGLDRRGKQLAVRAASGASIVIHLGMSGQVTFLPAGRRAERTDHVHCVWRLRRGPEAGRLLFRDPRRFGGLWALPDPDALAARWARLGPDALDVRTADLRRRLAATRRALKAALLDQAVLAGLGNIYVDEALHAAGLHPVTPAASVPPEAVVTLARSMRRILRAAVESGGSTLRDYRDGEGRSGAFVSRHRVYGRGGAPCLRCGGILDRLVVGQRTTVACRTCQPLPPNYPQVAHT